MFFNPSLSDLWLINWIIMLINKHLYYHQFSLGSFWDSQHHFWHLRNQLGSLKRSQTSFQLFFCYHVHIITWYVGSFLGSVRISDAKHPKINLGKSTSKRLGPGLGLPHGPLRGRRFGLLLRLLQGQGLRGVLRWGSSTGKIVGEIVDNIRK